MPWMARKMSQGRYAKATATPTTSVGRARGQHRSEAGHEHHCEQQDGDARHALVLGQGAGGAEERCLHEPATVGRAAPLPDSERGQGQVRGQGEVGLTGPEAVEELRRGDTIAAVKTGASQGRLRPRRRCQARQIAKAEPSDRPDRLEQRRSRSRRDGSPATLRAVGPAAGSTRGRCRRRRCDRSGRTPRL